MSDVVSESVWREIFAEQDAIAGDKQELLEVSLTSDQEIHRMWSRVSVGTDGQQVIDAYIRYFDQFTSAKNATVQQYVDDPMINRSVIAGRYRQAFVHAYPQSAGSNKENGTTWKFIQTLRKGFIQTLEGPNWSEARQVQVLNVAAGVGTVPVPEYFVDANQEDYLIIEWPNCDARYTELFRTQLNGDAQFTNVMVGGVSRPGSWWRASLVIDTDKADGSAKVTLTLARPQYVVKEYEKVGTPDECVTWRYTGVPKPLVVPILAAHQAVEGADASTRYSSGSGLVEINIKEGVNVTYTITVETANNCDYTESASVYYGYDLAQAEATISFAMSNRHVGETISASVPSLMSSGKYSFEIKTKLSIESSQRFKIELKVGGVTEEYVYAHNQRITGFNNTADPFIINASVFMDLHSAALSAKYSFRVHGFQKNEDCTFSWVSMVTGPDGIGDDTVSWTQCGGVVYQYVAVGSPPTSYKVQASYHLLVYTIKDYDDEAAAYATINEITGKYLDGSRVDPAGDRYRAVQVTDGGWTVFKDVGA